jgi:fatty acid desaturase
MSVVKFQKNKVTSGFIDSRLGKKIRTYLFFQGNNFANLDFFLQTMWIVIIFGIIYQLFSAIKGSNFSMIQFFLALSILGAFMYLMLFEAGRSRYLISFLPVLSLMSAFGYQTMGEENNESKYWTKFD